jgi:hypothetical protein
MDRFTRIYVAILGVVALVVLVAVFYESPKVGALNALLSDEAELAQYPYEFRVMDFDDGVATLSTPRAANFSAFRALRILFPELADEPDDSPRLYEAQQELAQLQARAAEAVRADPDVTRVAWKLDEGWLRDNGINPDLL